MICDSVIGSPYGCLGVAVRSSDPAAQRRERIGQVYGGADHCQNRKMGDDGQSRQCTGGAGLGEHQLSDSFWPGSLQHAHRLPALGGDCAFTEFQQGADQSR